MTTLSTFDAETAGNNEEIEMQFAVKTVEHLEAYEKIITSIPPHNLKLTPIDDEIHSNFLADFPQYADAEALRHLDENEMKSAKGKVRWRKFIMPYEKKLKDYNFGTMLRKDADREYAQDNSILVTRTQFFAVEIARNRAGLNDQVFKAAQSRKQASS